MCWGEVIQGGMSKSFRPWRVDEDFLLPPSLGDFVGAEHPARFIVALAREELDLSAIYAGYSGEKGQPPYHPAMMTALLLYGYSVGLYSSRRLAQACRERVDFLAITALDGPDFRTISDFRKRHLAALQGLFVQVLKLCAAAGLVRLGHVALDGTKLKANASKHKAMSYGRMTAREKQLEAEVARWLRAAETADAEEDQRHGDKGGNEMPEWVADKGRRLAKIRAAKAALEAEAKVEAEAEERRRAEAEKKRIAEARKKNGRTPAPPSREPDAKAQRNFTDPDSRILKTADGYIQGYNAQAAVDSAAQIIVAHGLTPSQSDHDQLGPLVDGIDAHLGRQPKEVSADAGYCSEANLAALAARRIAPYLATGRAKHPAEAKRTIAGPLTRAMRHKLKRAGRRSRYRLRKQIVEPVFGQIKQARGFRQFLLRGLDNVKAEWALICTAHNLTKLAKATA